MSPPRGDSRAVTSKYNTASSLGPDLQVPLVVVVRSLSHYCSQIPIGSKQLASDRSDGRPTGRSPKLGCSYKTAEGLQWEYGKEGKHVGTKDVG